jgi:hypothetical protein
VCAVDAEVVEQADRVGCHVGDLVVGGHRPPEHDRLRELWAGRRLALDLGRETGVAVVERNHPEATLHQGVDEPFRPVDQLPPEPHDQQQRLAFTTFVVLDGHAVRLHKSHTNDATGAFATPALGGRASNRDGDAEHEGEGGQLDCEPKPREVR